jgi:hypothetical protein
MNTNVCFSESMPQIQEKAPELISWITQAFYKKSSSFSYGRSKIKGTLREWKHMFWPIIAYQWMDFP